jgi:phosphoglucomutase
MESEPVIVGGEESGGLSVKGHIPEKDGILACLLMAELVAYEKRSLGAILKDLEKKTGQFHSDRLNLKFPAEQKEAILHRLSQGFGQIGGLAVQQFIKTDGYKFLLPNNEWVAFRASGTEPLIRCYIEAKTPAQLEKLRKACRKLVDVPVPPPATV